MRTVPPPNPSGPHDSGWPGSCGFLASWKGHAGDSTAPLLAPLGCRVQAWERLRRGRKAECLAQWRPSVFRLPLEQLVRRDGGADGFDVAVVSGFGRCLVVPVFADLAFAQPYGHRVPGLSPGVPAPGLVIGTMFSLKLRHQVAASFLTDSRISAFGEGCGDLAPEAGGLASPLLRCSLRNSAGQSGWLPLRASSQIGTWSSFSLTVLMW